MGTTPPPAPSKPPAARYAVLVGTMVATLAVMAALAPPELWQPGSGPFGTSLMVFTLAGTVLIMVPSLVVGIRRGERLRAEREAELSASSGAGRTSPPALPTSAALPAPPLPMAWCCYVAAAIVATLVLPGQLMNAGVPAVVAVPLIPIVGAGMVFLARWLRRRGIFRRAALLIFLLVPLTFLASGLVAAAVRGAPLQAMALMAFFAVALLFAVLGHAKVLREELRGPGVSAV